MQEGETPSSNGAKKQKLDRTNKNKRAPPPPYGSQEYWEERYQKNQRLIKSNGEDTSDALPYHPWYFSYSELSPLILPIILGGHDRGVNLLGGCIKEEKGDISDAEDGESQEGELVENTSNNMNSEAQPSVDGEEENPQDDIDDSEEAEEYDEEYEEDFDSDDEEDDTEESEGLAKDGPISIIEIGGGDMPLCRDLVMHLISLEQTTGAKADNIVKKMICCDYSPTVIDLCKENQKRDLQFREANQKGIEVEYITADARKLPYPDCSFDLVLEKGTLDAMLSDKEDGESNCVLIMTECARVLKERVSHLNAHTANGIDWLQCVVVTGLRSGAGLSSTWIVEVHGSDGTASTDNAYGEEIESKHAGESSGEGIDEVESQEHDTSNLTANNKGLDTPTENASKERESKDNKTVSSSQGPPSGSPGPAVYIIRNLTKPLVEDFSDDYEPPMVPLRFFSY